MARLGGRDGEILVEGAHNVICQARRVLMSRGIVGPFEAWKESVPYACMRGDIESKVEDVSASRADKHLLRVPFIPPPASIVGSTDTSTAPVPDQS